MANDLDQLSKAIARIENEMGRSTMRRRRRRHNPGGGDALGKTGRRLVRKQYTKDRGFLLRLGYRHSFDPPTDTPPFVTLFIGNPQVPVRPRRLVLYEDAVDAGALRQWVVSDIKIANKSQFVDGGSQFFPATAFLPWAAEILFKFDSCGPGEEIAVTLQQLPIFESPADFISAGMICHAADS